MLDLVREVHAERDPDRFPRTLLGGLSRAIPSSFAVYQQIDLRDVTSGFIVQWPDELIPSTEYAHFEARVRSDHPLPAHYTRFPDSAPAKILDFLTRRRYRSTALYAECYGPLRIEDQLSVPITLRYPRFEGVILNRDAPDFSERERRLLGLIRPHAIVARRNAQAYGAILRRLRAAEGALDACDRGLVVTDSRGRVRLRTDHARHWERTYLAPARRPEELAPTLRAWMQAALARLARSDDVPLAPAPLVVERGDQRLVVRLLANLARDEHLLVMEQRSAAVPRSALERLGLSPRETDVLHWVVLGKTNAEIGTILGLSPRTVQKHLERMFTKLGIESRVAAVGLAWEATTVGARGNVTA